MPRHRKHEKEVQSEVRPEVRPLVPPAASDPETFVERARASRWNSKAVEGTSLAMPLARESKGDFDPTILSSHRSLAMLTRR